MRRPQFVLTVLASILLFATLPLPARAQTRSRPITVPDLDPAAAAREHFMRGVQLFDEGSYDGALAEFRLSYDQSPLAGVLVNVALSLVELDRYDEAIDAYRRYLSAATHASAERRAAIEREIASLEARSATISLDVDRSGAEVLIDGRSVGSTPLTRPLRLTAGRRVLEVRLDGFVPVRDELEVVGGIDRSVLVRLAPVDRNGVIHIDAEPAEAELRIDGLDVGRAPVERRLPMGGHVIEGFLADYRTWRTDVQLADDQELALRIVMEHEGPDVTRDWWFWTIIGIGIVGAVGAITAGVVCGATDACTTTVVIPGNVDPGVLRL